MASVAFRLTDVDPSATMPGGFRHGGTQVRWMVYMSQSMDGFHRWFTL